MMPVDSAMVGAGPRADGIDLNKRDFQNEPGDVRLAPGGKLAAGNEAQVK
jgi:hypothetical protein